MKKIIMRVVLVAVSEKGGDDAVLVMNAISSHIVRLDRIHESQCQEL